MVDVRLRGAVGLVPAAVKRVFRGRKAEPAFPIVDQRYSNAQGAEIGARYNRHKSLVKSA
jgi:hypothetical protein